MAEDKDLAGRGPAAQNADNEPLGASRARNKTVMLSPEMTGQVRAMLHGDAPASPQGAAQNQQSAPADGFLRPKGSSEGFSALDALVGQGMAGQGIGGQGIGGQGQTRSFDPLTSISPSVTQGAPQGGQAAPRSFEAPSFVEPRGQAVQPVAPQAAQPQNPSFSFGAPAFGAPAFGAPATNVPPQFSQPAAPLQQQSVAPQVQQQAAPQFVQPAAKPVAERPAVQAAAPAMPAGLGWHSVVSNSGGELGKLVGLFVSYDKADAGELFEIRAGRFLVTSRPTENGDYLLVNDDSVSPLHAIVRATKDGTLQVLDQLSEHGTGVTRVGTDTEEEVSGGLATIQHGDIVRFGKRQFTVVAIPQVKRPK